MFCEKCGEELTEGTRFCTACGAKVVSLDTTVPMEVVETETVSAVAPVVSQPVGVRNGAVAYQPQAVPQKSKRPIVIGAVCAVIIIAAVVILLLFLFDSGEGSDGVTKGSAASQSVEMTSASSEAATMASETETGASAKTPVFTGINTSGAPQPASEAVQSVEEVFHDKDVISMVYTMDDGTNVMVITDSDSFSSVQLNVEE